MDALYCVVVSMCLTLLQSLYTAEYAVFVYACGMPRDDSDVRRTS